MLFDNYHIEQELYKGPRSAVYRARRISDGFCVVIKTHADEFPSVAELEKFKREFEIGREFNDPYIVKYLELLKWRHGYALVEEDFGAVSLTETIPTDGMEVSRFLCLAIKMVDGLAAIHKGKIIHKDIKPRNIITAPEKGVLKFIDFGISTKLHLENQSAVNLSVIEGTFAYMSPEQTGRMNRCLDYRSDYYSLGVTFYQMLSGKLPFNGTDSLELVHCHIAKIPTPLYEMVPGLPKIISHIVTKLMAKNAEDRYQSIHGLKGDLENCVRQLEEYKKIRLFTLGREDFTGRFQIPQKLYGREKELDILMRTFSRVAAGQTEILFVAGQSGIGKSSLINEIHKPIVARQGYFITGKYDQFQRNVPYSAIIQAFRELVGQLLTEPEARLEMWREKLMRALGDNGQVIIDIVPDLGLILGPQQQVSLLGPVESRNRLNLVFENFVKAFTKTGYPVVVFLDDLQWVDLASLSLLKVLVSDPDSHLMFIGAYRDNEVEADHPLVGTLEDLEKEHVIYNTLTLKPVELRDVCALVAETLSAKMEETEALAELVMLKTAGNPFFVNAFLMALSENGLLKFDFDQCKWVWDLEKIHQRDMTDNVVTLMLDKLKRLPKNTQHILQLASCIGNRFDLRVLAAIAGRTLNETAVSLMFAVQEGMISLLGSSHKIIQDLVKGEPADNLQKERILARFPHDRVQEAAYELIEVKRRNSVHLDIGRLLMKAPDEELSENLFAIADQMNQAWELITDVAEKIQVGKLNLRAGNRAKMALAFQAAESHFQMGIRLLPPKAWVAYYDLTFSLYLGRAECHYNMGRQADGKRCFAALLEKVRTNEEKARLLMMELDFCLTQNDLVGAREKALAGLGYCGMAFPRTGEERTEDVKREEAALERLLIKHPLTNLLDSSEMSDPLKRTAMSILARMATIGYNGGYYDMFRLSVLMGMRLMLVYGKNESSAIVCAWYSAMLVGEDRFAHGFEVGKLALALNKYYPGGRDEPVVCCIVAALALFYGEPIERSIDLYKYGFYISSEHGNFWLMSANMFNLVYHLFAQGRPLQTVEEEIRKTLLLSKKNKILHAGDFMNPYLQLIFTLRGVSESKWPEDVAIDSETWKRLRAGNGYPIALHTRFQRAFWRRQYEEAHEIAREFDERSHLLAGYIFPIEHDFLHAVLVTQQAEIELGVSTLHLKRVRKTLEKMESLAEQCPENFLHKACLIRAELARLAGEPVAVVMDLYEKAIAAASDFGFIQYEALANECYGYYWLKRGNDKIGGVYLREAHYLYDRWGAALMVEKLETDCSSHLRTTTASITFTTTGETSFSGGGGSGSISGSLDFHSIMKVTQALSSEMELERLLSKMMVIMIECAAAQRGFLILNFSGKLSVEASAVVDSEEVVVMQGLPIESCENVSETIVRYVLRSHENVVLHHASKSGKFVEDPYVKQNKPKSILCTPIRYKDRIIGALYLENNLATHTFTEKRIDVLRVLLSQAAISLENARLYSETNSLNRNLTDEIEERKRVEAEILKLNEELEMRVEERTKELKATQNQMIAQEKMASLGGLVAGVAHEINTPIGNGVMAASHLRRKAREFESLYTEGEITEEDFEEFLETSRGASDIILTNLERASELIRSFKQVAVDQSSKEIRTFHLNEYLEQVINSLAPKLKSTRHKVSIECDPELELESFPGAFSQIITNFVMNSLIHGFESKAEGHIKIQVVMENERICLTYRDDGRGIPELDLKKIFDPFFTTKRAKGGTGLGLHIIYNIVTQQLGGTIRCESEAGKGTAFFLDCPLKIVASPAGASPG